MEYNQNGRQPKWKTIEMENDQNGRRSKRNATKMENEQNERKLERKMSNQLYCYQTEQLDCKQHISQTVIKQRNYKVVFLGVSYGQLNYRLKVDPALWDFFIPSVLNTNQLHRHHTQQLDYKQPNSETVIKKRDQNVAC